MRGNTGTRRAYPSHGTKCKHCSLDGKNILAAGSQGIPQSHSAQQTSQDRIVGREKTRRVAASAGMRNSRELNGYRDYIEFLENRVELCKVELSRVKIGGILCPEIGRFAL